MKRTVEEKITFRNITKMVVKLFALGLVSEFVLIGDLLTIKIDTETIVIDFKNIDRVEYNRLYAEYSKVKNLK